MTETSVTLTQYLDKIGVDLNGDFLREGARLMAQMAMDWGVKQQIGAARYERSPLGPISGMGTASGLGTAEVGSILLEVPKLRSGRTSRASWSLAGVRRRRFWL